MSELLKLDVSDYGWVDREARARWEAAGYPDYGWALVEGPDCWYVRAPWDKPQTKSLLRDMFRGDVV